MQLPEMRKFMQKFVAMESQVSRHNLSCLFVHAINFYCCQAMLITLRHRKKMATVHFVQCQLQFKKVVSRHQN